MKHSRNWPWYEELIVTPVYWMVCLLCIVFAMVLMAVAPGKYPYTDGFVCEVLNVMLAIISLLFPAPYIECAVQAKRKPFPKKRFKKLSYHLILTYFVAIFAAAFLFGALGA